MSDETDFVSKDMVNLLITITDYVEPLRAGEAWKPFDGWTEEDFVSRFRSTAPKVIEALKELKELKEAPALKLTPVTSLVKEDIPEEIFVGMVDMLKELVDIVDPWKNRDWVESKDWTLLALFNRLYSTLPLTIDALKAKAPRRDQMTSDQKIKQSLMLEVWKTLLAEDPAFKTLSIEDQIRRTENFVDLLGE